VDETSDSAAIVGQTDVGEADLSQALARLPGNQRPWLLPVLMVAATLVFVALSPSRVTPEMVLSFVLPVLVVAILMTYIQLAGKRAWVKQALANVGGPTTYRFDDFGFSSESKLRQHRLAWAALARTVETPDAFLIYTTPQTVLIVPKRAFTATDIATLGEWLPQRVKQQPVAKLGLTGRVSGRGTLLMWVVLVVTFLSIWHFLSIDDAPSRRQRNPHESAAIRAEELGEGGETSGAR
jgi:hypothetical protein